MSLPARSKQPPRASTRRTQFRRLSMTSTAAIPITPTPYNRQRFSIFSDTRATSGSFALGNTLASTLVAADATYGFSTPNDASADYDCALFSRYTNTART